jgi:hypothetical protein
MVAHACNPSYSGGRDQKDHGSKPAWVNSSARPYLQKPFTNIGLVEWFKVKALSSSPSTTHIKKIKMLTPGKTESDPWMEKVVIVAVNSITAS